MILCIYVKTLTSVFTKIKRRNVMENEKIIERLEQLEKRVAKL